MDRKKIIIVIGCTGTGKSKLAIDVAKSIKNISHYEGAEVISADSMQVYKVTNLYINFRTF